MAWQTTTTTVAAERGGGGARAARRGRGAGERGRATARVTSDATQRNGADAAARRLRTRTGDIGDLPLASPFGETLTASADELARVTVSTPAVVPQRAARRENGAAGDRAEEIGARAKEHDRPALLAPSRDRRKMKTET